MARGKGGQFYDDDDLDDGYDDYDDDYYDDDAYAEADAPAEAPGKTTAAEAGASKLAQALCDPPPLKPNGKQQKGAKVQAPAAAQKQSFPIAPAAATGAAQRFYFSTPSPDDEARTAGPKIRPVVGVSLPKAPAAKAAAAPQQQQASSCSSSAAAGLAGLSLRESDTAEPGPQSAAAAAAAAAAPSAASRRRVDGYRLEADLDKACQAAAAAEASGAGARPGLHLVVLGHVDAGKSTLMGRLLHELGAVSSKEVHKHQREAAQMGKASFAWAWALDERPEERARGVTVDVAMARFSTPKLAVTLLDAPGHRDFVPNMISGAAQADAALLLVDGSPGGFEAGFEGSSSYEGSGQTREHAQLARSLGIEQLAVVVSKLDTVDYSQERFDYIRSQLLPFLKQCGFKEDMLQWLPAVGPLAENLTDPPTDPLLKSWWRGPSVVQAIDNFRPRARSISKPLRMPISDVFKTKQGAVTVGGKLEGGAMRPGSKVLLVPGYEPATVKSIEVSGQPVQLARAGDSADVVLTGVDASNLAIGAVLCHPEYPVPVVRRVEMQVVVLDVTVPVLKGQAVTLHAHCTREAGHISALLALLNAKTGEVQRLKPRCLTKGQTALVEVTPGRGMCLEEASDYRSLGRVALREGGRTIAVGLVTKILE